MREVEVVVLRLLQEDFPLCPRPFLELACRANRGFCRPRTVYFEVIGPGPRRRPIVARHKVKPVSEKDIISATASLVRRGQVRRVAGIFAQLEEEAAEEAGRLAEELRAGLPVVAEPYREVAAKVGLTEEELFNHIRTMRQTGALRRISAILGPPMKKSQQGN